MEQVVQTAEVSVEHVAPSADKQSAKSTNELQPRVASHTAAKYRNKVNSTVTEINNELNKILSSGSTIKNIKGLEEDMSILTRKITEVKKALAGVKKEPEIHSPHATKIYRSMEKLIEIANRYEINENDQKEIISELRKNIGEANGVVSLIKKALEKSEKSEDFNLSS